MAAPAAVNPQPSIYRSLAPIITRFAPSPNGSLHLGHAYAAIRAHDLAMERGGTFLLRIEDIDGARSRPELADEHRADLQWLGLSWDEVPAQSTRLARYEDAARSQLMGRHGLLYACECTRAQIAQAATRTGPDGPIYPGTCKDKRLDTGRSDVALRIDMERAADLAGPLEWSDELAGRQTATPEIFGDVVLMRKDAPASYHLAVTMDDAADGVTLATRGADLFPATHIHRLLQALLELPVPRWHHHPLLLDTEGRKLAKRRGSPSLADRRRSGEDGRKVAELLRSGNLPTGISLSE